MRSTLGVLIRLLKLGSSSPGSCMSYSAYGVLSGQRGTLASARHAGHCCKPFCKCCWSIIARQLLSGSGSERTAELETAGRSFTDGSVAVQPGAGAS